LKHSGIKMQQDPGERSELALMLWPKLVTFYLAT
jgi:hypothetical protein